MELFGTLVNSLNTGTVVTVVKLTNLTTNTVLKSFTFTAGPQTTVSADINAVAIDISAAQGNNVYEVRKTNSSGSGGTLAGSGNVRSLVWKR